MRVLLLHDGFLGFAMNNEHGFTLIEVLVALTILAAALAAMLGSFSTAGRANADIYGYSVALSLAQSKLEELKDCPFAQVVNKEPAESLTEFSEERDFAGYAGFQYALVVTDNDLFNKTVVVTVFYSDAGVEKEVALTGEVARR